MIKTLILYTYYVLFFEFSLIFRLFSKIFIKSNRYHLSNKNIINDRIDDFNKNGFCKFLLDNQSIDTFNLWNKRFKFLQSFQNKKFFSDIIVNKSNVYFYARSKLLMLLFFPESRNIIYNSSLYPVLKSILGNSFSITDNLYTSKNYQSNKSNEVFSSFWHFDWRRHEKKWLRVMLYLSDQEKQESLQCFDKKTSFYALKNKYFGRYEHSKLPDDLKDKYHSIDGKKGTAIIVNTADILHRAGDPVENKSRLTFFILLNSEKGWGDNNNFLLMPKV